MMFKGLCRRLTSITVLQATMNEVGKEGNTLYIARDERLSGSFCWLSIHWWRSSGPGDSLAHMLAFYAQLRYLKRKWRGGFKANQ